MNDMKSDTTNMSNASALLEQLDVEEIIERLEELEGQKEALRILLRSASRSRARPAEKWEYIAATASGMTVMTWPCHYGRRRAGIRHETSRENDPGEGIEALARYIARGIRENSYYVSE